MTGDKMTEVHGVAARFRLLLRCDFCLVDSEMVVSVPAVEGAPENVDELVESEFLARQRFQCRRCDSPIATLVGVAQFRRRDAA